MNDDSNLHEQQLRQELRALESALSQATDHDDFVHQVVQAQMERRESDVQKELQDVRQNRVTVHLYDPQDRSAVDTSLLGNLLTRWQTAITWVGWALQAGPGVEGTPPASIASRTSTEVVALAPGSFQVVLQGKTLEIPMPEESSERALLDDSLDHVFQLARAGARGDFPTELEDLTQELGGEPTRRLSLWFKKLAESSLTTRLGWAARPAEQVTISPAESRMLAEWLEHVQDEIEELTVRGVLRMADEDRGRFHIEDSAGNHYEGKAAPQLVTHKEIGAEYEADLQANIEFSMRTGSRSEKYTLINLRPTQ